MENVETLHEFFVLTKGTEYLIAVAFLILFPVFWKLLSTPKPTAATPEAASMEPASMRPAPSRLPFDFSAVPTLADGGLPLKGLAERLTEEEWQELRKQFFDQSAEAEEEPS